MVSSISPSEVRQLLSEHGVILVHFSGISRTSQFEDLYFPDDLKTARAGDLCGGVCCSTLGPRDSYTCTQMNAVGEIGIIINPKSESSVRAASASDAGSWINVHSGCREVETSKELPEACKESILRRGEAGYNEWVVQDYNTVGIFYFPNPRIAVESTYNDPVTGQEQVTNGIASLELESLASDFADLRKFSIKDQKFQEVHPCGAMSAISVSDIYGI